jgi:hypothetical protein
MRNEDLPRNGLKKKRAKGLTFAVTLFKAYEEGPRQHPASRHGPAGAAPPCSTVMRALAAAGGRRREIYQPGRGRDLVVTDRNPL